MVVAKSRGKLANRSDDDFGDWEIMKMLQKYIVNFTHFKSSLKELGR